MATKIRLQRHGKKGRAFYYIVVADSRTKRDGKYIQKLGSYNPNTNPATIDINLEDSVQWLQRGAQPTDTCRAILSYKGVLYKNHLLKGVTKGALTVEQANAKFEKWVEEKSGKIEAKKSNLSKTKEEKLKEALAAEKKSSSAKEQIKASKHTPAPQEDSNTTVNEVENTVSSEASTESAE